jgi:hypothetical protein
LALVVAARSAAADPGPQWRILLSAHRGGLRVDQQITIVASPKKTQSEPRDDALELRLVDAEGRTLHRQWIPDPRTARIAAAPGETGHIALSMAAPIPFVVRIPAIAAARALEIAGLGRVELAAEKK